MARRAGTAANSTYQAGASTEPAAVAVNQVKIAGANPPKIVMAAL
jgi:hypothetical protein